MADAFLAGLILRLVLDLLKEQDWTQHLSLEQIRLIEQLQEAETIFIKVHQWTSGLHPALVFAALKLTSPCSAVI